MSCIGLSFLFGFIVTLVITSCNKNTSSTDTEQTVLTTSAVSEKFKAFINKFPKKEFPVTFPTVEDEYNEMDLVPIDPEDAEMFFLEYTLPYGTEDPGFYHSALEVHPDLLSVVIYQKSEISSVYVLVNFNYEGDLLGSSTLASYEYGTGVINQSKAVVDGQQITITEMELGRKDDYYNEWKVMSKIHRSGVVLPAGLPRELVTTLHDAVLKNGVYLVNPTCMGGDETMSESFQLSMCGDSILYFPFPDGHTLMAERITLSKDNVYNISFKDIDDPADGSITDIQLMEMKGSAGVYHVGDASSNDYVIAASKLAAYKTRLLPCVEDRLISGRGVSGIISVGEAVSKITHAADENNLNHRTYWDVADQKDYQRLYNSNNEPVLQIDADPQTKEITSITLYTDFFRTERGVAVGSTVADLLYAYENVTAICGEYGVLLSVGANEYITFFVDDTVGPPDTEVDPATLDQSLKISRIDIR